MGQVLSTWEVRVLRTLLVFLSDVVGAANPSAGIIVVVSGAFARTCHGV